MRLATVIALAIPGGVSADEPEGGDTRTRAEPNSTRRPGPLERLRLRSARERWLKLRDEFQRDHGARSERRQSQSDESIPVQREARTVPLPQFMPPNRDRDETPRIPNSGTNSDPLPPRPRDPPAPSPASTGPGAIVHLLKRRVAEDTDEPADDEAEFGETGHGSEMKKITDIRPYLSYATEGIDLDLIPDGADDALSSEPYLPREMPRTLFQWKASNIHYRPLYFEDGPLERYGHTHNPYLQPFMSAHKFAVQLVGLPYQMVLRPMCKCEYPLGWYRPGECAPKKCYRIPFGRQPAIVQAGVVTGLFFLIP